MEYIDITEKLEEFYRHLSEDNMDRTIFSAKFGDGKTVFLNEFKEEYSNEYTFYTLYPVNYQIAPNEQIMEYIKRDLLFQLILNGTLTPIDNIPDSILLQWYVNENLFDIAKDIIKFTPSILGSENQFVAVLKGITALVKGIKEQCKKFDEFKTKITEGDFEKAVNIIEKLSEGAGNIYELDPISWLIAQSIAKQDKKSVLIIEDLDRIDPAHLFRILNIFSAHIDRKYLCSDETIYKDGEEKKLDELSNKFGFDKIIFVMDAESTEAAFMNFYGNSNYEGYISKFISKRIFHYSIINFAEFLLYLHIMGECGEAENIFDKALQAIKFKLEQKSVRDIAKVLDNFEVAYRKEKIKVTEDFCFFSDTPLVKLLAILGRLGVNKNQLSVFLEAIEPKEKLIELLGCFAMDKNSVCNNRRVYYNGVLYQIVFPKDKNGYRTSKRARSLNKNIFAEEYRFLEININEILEKALKYVN
jgi:hypothetical protein